MNMKLAVILALAMILVWPLQGRSQQPIKHFGYFGPSSDSDLSRVRSYTNFSYVDGEYGVSIVNVATRVKNNNMRSVIDLGKVLWCPSPGDDLWHLCGINGEVDYATRWYNWRSMNASVLNGNYVLAFSVITEHTKREIPTADVETAVDLVKSTTGYQIPTLVSVGLTDIERPHFDLPSNADWIGFAAYYTHPNIDSRILQDLQILKSKKHSWQRMAYTLDGFHSQNHLNAGLTLDNMDTIAQEWYTFASRDPEAVLLAVFAWFGAPDTGGIGSMSFPQHVLDKHAAIGTAIFSGRSPTYQGTFDRIDCQSLAGWAWDAGQPNTPISVDIYDGWQKLATVRADQYRQDLVTAGIGNGRHGFSFTLPASLRNGQNHWVMITYSGLYETLNLSPKSITCAAGASASIAWIKPAESSWGPPNTMTVAGYAQNGSGGVQLVWRDVTINGPWNFVSWQPTPGADNTWSNTIPSPYRCHTFQAYVNYSGVQSAIFTYNGLSSGYCNESARVIWIQPQSLAGFGPPGSLVIAGSATNAPSGTQVYLWYRNVSLGTGWTRLDFAPLPGSDGIWYNSIENANPFHQYQVYVTYDVITSSTCTYAGGNSATNCQ